MKSLCIYSLQSIHYLFLIIQIYVSNFFLIYYIIIQYIIIIIDILYLLITHNYRLWSINILFHVVLFHFKIYLCANGN